MTQTATVPSLGCRGQARVPRARVTARRRPASTPPGDFPGAPHVHDRRRRLLRFLERNRTGRTEDARMRRMRPFDPRERTLPLYLLEVRYSILCQPHLRPLQGRRRLVVGILRRILMAWSAGGFQPTRRSEPFDAPDCRGIAAYVAFVRRSGETVARPGDAAGNGMTIRAAPTGRQTRGIRGLGLAGGGCFSRLSAGFPAANPRPRAYTL